MKLIIAIVQDQDSHLLSDEFSDKGIRATRLATTGGFLRSGNTTFMIGVDDEKVEEVLNIIRDNCQSREQYTTPPMHIDSTIDSSLAFPVPVRVGGATVFVLPVESFQQF